MTELRLAYSLSHQKQQIATTRVISNLVFTLESCHQILLNVMKVAFIANIIDQF